MIYQTTEFKLTDNFVSKFKGKQPAWGPLGYFTFKRSYARDKGNGRTEEYWETCQRVVEGTFLIQKLHCLQNHLAWNERKAQQSAQEMYKRMFEFKFLPPGRGLWAMGTEFVLEKSSAPLYNCFTGDEKFFVYHGLHYGGWECVSFKEVFQHEINKTSFHVSNIGHGLARAKVESFGIQPVNRIVFKPIHGNRTAYRHTAKATPNHRWILADGSETTSLRVGDDVPIQDFTNLQDITSPGFGMDEYDEGYVHGAIFGDGTQNCHYPNRFMLLVCGDKLQANLSKFEQVSGKISFVSNTIQTSTNGKQYPYITVVSDNNLKKVPYQGSYAYMRGFLDGWIAADGHYDNEYSLTLDTINNEGAMWLSEWATVLGYPIVGRSIENSPTNFGPRTSSLQRTTLAYNPKKSVVFRVESIESIGEEEVYCVVVQEQHKPKQFTLAGGLLTGNCGFISTKDIKDDFSFPFVWLMDMSLMGVGVGFDTLGGAAELYLKKPRQTKDVHIIEDSREGWVDAFKRVLDAFTGVNTLPDSFDYSLIRPAGSPIKTFGGIAPGSDPLRKLLERTEAYMRSYVDEDKPVDSTFIVDLMNFAGACVVAGGTRRTAEIAFGSPKDEDFLNLKNPEMVAHPEFARWASNNSVTMEIGDDYTELAKQAMVNGEPGFMWLDNARHYGRLKDPRNEHDRNVMGTNPCGEITLNHAELCNIVETFPSNHSDLDDYLRTLKYAFLYSKTVTLLATHNSLTNQVQMKNRRIGVSQSGIVENINKIGLREHLRWSDKGYQELKKWDQIYSDWLCIRKSIKLTTVKPSGTVSLLPGKTPGIHYPHSEYYIRRIRVSKNSDLVQTMQDAGYTVVADVYEKDHTMVVEFPVHEPNFAKRKADVSLWEQLELAAALQSEWADNSVSITVTVKPEEAKDLARALEMFETRLKSVSFLPLTDHQYKQAPYEEISAETFADLTKRLKRAKIKTFEAKEAQFCDADVCEYKPPSQS